MLVGSKTEKPQVVIDTNVFVSGLNFRGRPREVLDLVWRGEIEVHVSPFILRELEETLEEDFGWNTERVERTTERIKKETTQVQPKTKISVIKEKETDNRILERGIEGKAQYIISGDKRHLLPLKEYKDIKILSPAQFLKIISQEVSSGGF
ncbi:MAG: putative toxin-antitoxin system toxin component, PIN family [bacterium]